MYSITKQWTFSAAHALDHLPESHKCHALHGHNYTVGVRLTASALEPDGMLVDYGDLSVDLGAWIDANLDHKNLNDFMAGPTTAERLAKAIYDRASMYDWGHLVTSVLVKETDGTSAMYRP
jgi:6-pyruvoyltetrahydropterin/6-carboxytetrahydropterin synthase